MLPPSSPLSFSYATSDPAVEVPLSEDFPASQLTAQRGTVEVVMRREVMRRKGPVTQEKRINVRFSVLPQANASKQIREWINSNAGRADYDFFAFHIVRNADDNIGAIAVCSATGCIIAKHPQSIQEFKVQIRRHKKLYRKYIAIKIRDIMSLWNQHKRRQWFGHSLGRILGAARGDESLRTASSEILLQETLPEPEGDVLSNHVIAWHASAVYHLAKKPAGPLIPA